jgi:hypothetical protein
MQTRKLLKNKVSIKFSGSDIYLEKRGIIQDKVCKNCKKLILNEEDFCECGFFLKSEKNSVFWTSVIFPAILIGIVWLVGATNYNVVRNLAVEKINKHEINFTSLSPTNIQMIVSLKNSPYNDYIQTIHVKQGQKNILQVLVRPTSWDLLTPKEKKDLLSLVTNNWKIIYKQNYPDSVLKPAVEFANPE